jgi:hypothetical protein
MMIGTKTLEKELEELWLDTQEQYFYSGMDAKLFIDSIEITKEKTTLYRKNGEKIELLTGKQFLKLFDTSIESINLFQETFSIRTDVFIVFYSYSGRKIHTEEV